MRIFYITTEDPALQGDYLECMALIGLRRVFGDYVIDIPRKKVMYGDFSDSPKDQLHGRGFSLFSRPISDISNREIEPTKDDVLIYGVVPGTYGVKRRPDLEEKVGLTVVLDGHDDVFMRPEFDDENILYFKRELNFDPTGFKNLRPINFSIPSWCIRSVDFSLKKKLLPRTVPRGCFEKGYHEQGRGHYVFDNEEDYYRDLQESWFAATCKKGGWDQLRHLEAVAAGCVVLWKNWYNKPQFCGPRNFPAAGFVDQNTMEITMKKLIENGRPTEHYLSYLNDQRSWLDQHGTCEAVATYVYEEILKFKNELV